MPLGPLGFGAHRSGHIPKGGAHTHLQAAGHSQPFPSVLSLGHWSSWVWQAGALSPRGYGHPTSALSPTGKRGQLYACWPAAPWSTALLRRSSNFAGPRSSPLPMHRGDWQQQGLESSVHELCKVVCEQLLS